MSRALRWSSFAVAVLATATFAPAAQAQDGKALYARCTACHQETGKGIPNAFPPLAGSSWVTGPASRAIAIVLHGVQGPLKVGTATYNGVMIAYGTGQPMTDAEVAAVVTYIRTSWGNKASAVTAAQVAQVRAATKARKGAFTEAELLKLQ
jgi:mono/diheme cytochrome c family protein